MTISWRIDYLESWSGNLFSNRLDTVGVFAERTAAGWTASSGTPRIEYTGTKELYDVYGNAIALTQNGDPYESPSYFKRIAVHLPDGTTHEMRLDETPHPFTPSNPNYEFNGAFLSTDGSRMRLDLSAGESKLFLPDGSFYTFAASSNTLDRFANKYTDRNGNYLTFDANAKTWTDTFGRTITQPIPMNMTFWPRDQLQTVGDVSYQINSTSSQPRSVVFSWRQLKGGTAAESGLADFSQPLHYLGDRLCNGEGSDERSPALFVTLQYPSDAYNRICANSGNTEFNPVVLTKIALPNGTSYNFKYNVYGEIERVEHPTGAYERFRYDNVQPIGFAKLPYVRGNRGVVEHWVSPSGVGGDEQHWRYGAYTGSSTGICRGYTIAPDTTHSERVMPCRRTIHNNLPLKYGYQNALDGTVEEELAYSKADAQGVSYLMGRKLTTRIVDKAVYNVGYVSEYGTHRDARVARTITIMFEPNTEQALATMTEMNYDSNTDPQYFAALNVKSVKTYKYKVINAETAKTADANTIAAQFTTGDVQNTSEIDYIYDPSYLARGILGLVSETRLKNSAGAVVSRMLMEYDEPAYLQTAVGGTPTGWQNQGTSVRGLATSVSVWDDSANNGAGGWTTTHAKYDQFGNVTEATNALGNFVKSEYSPDYNYAYPTKVTANAPDPSGVHGTNTTSQITTTYDFDTGLTLTVTDANGNTSGIEYDVMLRPKRTIPAAGGGVTEIERGETPGSLYVKTRSQIDDTNWAEKIEFMDGLGRPYKSRTKDAQGDVFVEVQYDEAGRLKQLSNPYRQGEQKLWSKPRYDAAGRAVETFAPAPNGQTGASLGIVSFGISTVPGFVGRYSIETDASGRKSRSITNALGQLVRLDEPTGNNDLGAIENPNQPTVYTYSDGLGQLIKVQQGGQSRYFMNDALGRVTRIKLPEQTANPNLATTGNPENNQWTSGFTYDILGRVVTSTDAKGLVITNAYDRAGRVTTRSYSDGVTPQVDYYYDGAGLAQIPQNSKGQLTKISSSVSETRFTAFDNEGGLLASQQITDGQTYNFAYKYNLGGDLVEETYPSGRVVKNFLGSDGGLLVASTKSATSAYKVIASNFDYSAAGEMRAMRLGNGRWETAQYNTRHQLMQIGLGSSATNTGLWRTNYEYGELSTDGASVDANKNTGAIARQTTTIPTTNFVTTYRYDELMRLTEARETTESVQNWQQSFGYDRFGNRTSFSQTVGSSTLAINNLTLPSVDPNKNRFTTGQGYEYDFNGNLTVDANGKKFAYDGNDKQTQVQDANNVIVGTYYYAPDGARVKRVTQTETTVFVYDAGGALAAEYSTGTQPNVAPATSYLTSDHLGSPRVVTNQSGEVTARRDFMPFGEDVGAGIGGRTEGQKYSSYGGDKLRQRFTGYERDAESDLDFAQARMYKRGHGRFTSVDPAISSMYMSNPQTLNRYSYTGNDPVNNTDPTGLDYYRDKDDTIVYFSGSEEHEGYTRIVNEIVHIERGGDVNGFHFETGDTVHFYGDSFQWVSEDVRLNDGECVCVDVETSSGDIAEQMVESSISGAPFQGPLPSRPTVPAPTSPTGSDAPTKPGDSVGSAPDSRTLAAYLIYLILQAKLKEIRDGQKQIIVRRFDTKQRIKDALKNGIIHDGSAGGIPTTSRNIRPINPDKIRKMLGMSREPQMYIDIDITNKRYRTRNTKAGHIEYSVLESINPSDIVEKGNVERSKFSPR